MPQHKTMLPQAGPVPVFQTALKDSRFGFSATDRSFNLTHHASNQGHSLQVIQLNLTHSNIDDNGNNDDDSSDDDSNEDNNNDNNNIYQGDGNGGDMGKWLPKSLFIYKLIVWRLDSLW